MSDLTAVGLQAPRVATAARRSGYDWLVVAACAWFQFGAYLDVWAHIHRPELESFFTPWHGVLYSGFLAVAALTVAPLLRRPRDRPWIAALPAGYDLSLLGVLVFMFGGLADMAWHVLFGIEVDVEALLSPSHLVLAAGSILFVTGPLRAAWVSPDDPSAPWLSRMPAIVSLGLLLSSFAFWTPYGHPLVRPWPAVGNEPVQAIFPVVAADPLIRGGGIPSVFVGQGWGVANILLQTFITMGLVLVVVRRWPATLPAGAFTVVFTMSAVLVGFSRDQLVLVPGALLAGVVTDLLLHRLRPGPTRPRALRVFALSATAAYWALYFLNLAVAKGLWWSIHLWAGSIVVAAAAGWLLSYLVAPPAPNPRAPAPPVRY